MASTLHNCLLGTPFDRDESSKITRVEFWYAVESTVNYSPSLSYQLESEITDVAKSSLTWCHRNGGRRMEEAGKAYFLDESGRRLGIMAMNSGPLDQPNIGQSKSIIIVSVSTVYYELLLTELVHS